MLVFYQIMHLGNVLSGFQKALFKLFIDSLSSIFATAYFIFSK